ncbi:MAG: DHH family phosphoesterase [Sedimentisphaerales bacterium]|nr:DHH family phosphoesterase [Sedimentisphaerales bacterium]
MDFKCAIEMIQSASNILVTSHIRPDGDAVGSVIALSRSLSAQARLDNRNITCQTLFLSSAGEPYRFLLDQQDKVIGENFTEEQLTAEYLDAFDLIIVVDTRSARQMPAIGDYLLQRTEKGKPTLAIDHHLSGDAIGTCQVIDTDASAAGEVVYRLCRAADWPLDRKALEAIFTAICTDTGWFHFQNTNATALHIAAELVSGGVAVDKIYQQLFQNHTPAKVLLISQALQSLQLLSNDRLAVMSLTQADLKKCGADRGMIENIVNEPMQIGTVEASIMCVEMEEPGKTRFSLRSKQYLDMNAIANTMGGGGHARAAGLTIAEPIEEAKAIVIAKVIEELNKP